MTVLRSKTATFRGTVAESVGNERKRGEGAVASGKILFSSQKSRMRKQPGFFHLSTSTNN